jgi:hypothetical protein
MGPCLARYIFSRLIHSNYQSEMESVQRNKSVPGKSRLAMRSSKSSGSRDEDGFYPKTPDTQSTDDERQKLGRMEDYS